MHTQTILWQEADCPELLAEMLPTWQTRPAQTCMNMPGGSCVPPTGCVLQRRTQAAGGERTACFADVRGLEVKGLKTTESNVA